MQLRRLEAIEADIAALDLRISERLEPYRMPHALLMQIQARLSPNPSIKAGQLQYSATPGPSRTTRALRSSSSIT
jgi:hypothetical protein